MRALRILKGRGDAIGARVHGEVASALDGDASPRGLAAAAERAGAAADREGARALAISRRDAPACSAGCSYCCHVHVDATVPEILAIVAHLDHTRSAEARASLRDTLARRATQVAASSDEQRWSAKIPCALLGDDGRCSIYEARPLRCRAFHSCSVEPCRAAFEGRDDLDPLANPLLTRAHDAAEEGYGRALAGAGLSADAHRLELALRIALDDPEAGARWIAGEPVFAEARAPQREPG